MRVRVLDGVVLPEMLADLRRACDGLIYRYGWKSVIGKPWPGLWTAKILAANEDKVQDVGRDLDRFEPPFDVFRAYWAYLRGAGPFSPEAALLRMYANTYTYGTDGYPHTDSKREEEVTAVLYLCREWLPEWAGATAVWAASGGEIERAVMPKPGRLLIFPGNSLHAAWAVSRVCPVERRVLVVKVRN